MVDALHHVYDYQATLSELWRVVKPGGRIVIEEPDIQTLPVKFMALLEKVALMRSHFISPQIIQENFRKLDVYARVETEGSTAWIVVDKPS
jgi:demethylmenaquinone methyltransferase/2-methoxy-6-polyprenyl-1,4-benzoquinol methylase